MTAIELTEADGTVLAPCVLRTIHSENPDILPLPVAFVIHGDDTPIVSRWQPTQDERDAIAAGQDIYVTVLTYGRRLPPLAVGVGVPLFDGLQSQPRA